MKTKSKGKTLYRKFRSRGEVLGCYKLAGDPLEWARWMEKAKRHVAKTTIGKVWVSTVFLGLDHQWGQGKPILFETMVFGGKLDQEQQRYCTWTEAVKGHKAMVKRVKAEK